MNVLLNHPYLTTLTVGAIVAGVIFILGRNAPGITTPVLNNDNKPEKIRKMAVAGTFYTADSGELKLRMDKYLNEAGSGITGNDYSIIITPHAGMDYAGATAATGFAQLQNKKVNKVIILGPSHYEAVQGAAVLENGLWETPWGNVKIDGDLARNIVSPEQSILANPAVHKKEHAMEMEVLWLKQVLSDFEIVPILIGQATPEMKQALAFKIARNMDDATVLVISTDLSHYPDYDTANKVDKQTIDSILDGQTIQNAQGVETVACGIEAIRVAQLVAQLRGMKKPVLFKYQNSGDSSGDKNRVVGYAAIGYPRGNGQMNVPLLSEEAQIEAKEIASTTLNNFVNNKQVLRNITVNNDVINAPLGAFVTLREDGQLRGCIGEFEPNKPLYQVIIDKTMDAASRDPRFSPVTPGEVGNIEVEISVMTPRQRIYNWQNIRPGTDGVVVVSGNKSGVFLPQVATENNWGLTQFLEELCSQKAGLPRNCYRDPKTELYTFQTQVF